VRPHGVTCWTGTGKAQRVYETNWRPPSSEWYLYRTHARRHGKVFGNGAAISGRIRDLRRSRRFPQRAMTQNPDHGLAVSHTSRLLRLRRGDHPGGPACLSQSFHRGHGQRRVHARGWRGDAGGRLFATRKTAACFAFVSCRRSRAGTRIRSKFTVRGWTRGALDPLPPTPRTARDRFAWTRSIRGIL